MASRVTATTVRPEPARPPEDHTPRPRRWARAVYEAVVPTIWLLLLDGVAPRPDGRHQGERLEKRLSAAIGALTARTSPALQEALLAALDEPFGRDVGPIEPGCTCPACAPARE